MTSFQLSLCDATEFREVQVIPSELVMTPLPLPQQLDTATKIPFPNVTPPQVAPEIAATREVQVIPSGLVITPANPYPAAAPTATKIPFPYATLSHPRSAADVRETQEV